MLHLTQLEDRLTPAVKVWTGVIMPNPTTGEPAQVVRLIQGDPQHSPGREVVLPAHANGRFDRIWVGA